MRRIRTWLSIAAALALVATFLWAGSGRVGKVHHDDDASREFAEEAAEEAQESLARFDEPLAAQNYFAQKRSPDVKYSRGHDPVVPPLDSQRYVTARAEAANMPRYDSSAKAQGGGNANDYGGAWTPLGPGNVGGRTRQVLIDPTNTNVMYAASVAGGVWKSTNAGALWSPLDDSMANLAVSSLAMTPGTPGTLYAGTGEGFFNGDAVRGAGIFKTTNGGTSWAQLATTATSNFYYVNDIVVSPLDPSRVYAATRAGVYRSLDSGATWAQVLDPNTPLNVNGCTDLAIRTDAGLTDRIFASCGTFATLTIYRNTDAGGAGTWDAVYTNANFGRASLAIAPSNQDTVYALASSIAAGTYNNGLGAVLRTTTGGGSGSWTVQVDNTSPTVLNRVLLSNPPFALACPGFGAVATFLNQGWYDNVIAVDPLDPDRVWTGGIDLFRSDDGGANFGIASYWYKNKSDARYAHADNHAIAFHPGYNGTTNKTMFVGSDGGIFKTLDARATTATGTTAPCDATVTSATVWSNLNNSYQVTQFYDGAVFPNGSSYFGGLQDNGTVLGTTGAGTNGWTDMFGGDGGYVAVDPTNTNVQFLETTRLSLRKSTTGSGGPFNSATSGIGAPDASGNFLFIAPFHMSKANPQVLFTGGYYIWRTTNQATSWTQASAITAGVGSISALATSPVDANQALVGMNDGYIHRSSTALTTTSATSWANVQPRTGNNSSLTFHPTNSQIAYATYSTFGGSHVWRTTDGGASWTARDGSGPGLLPDIPAHSLAINPDNPAHLYLGTDLGVFVSLDEGLNWARENSGYANVITEKVLINTVGGVDTLFAFTHGRSAWKVQLAEGTTAKKPADFDGNGTTDKSVYRPSTGQWFVNGGSPAVTVYGVSSDVPVPADYDGNGTTDKAVYRPSTGQWFVQGGSPEITVFGAAGDIPVPGDYDGNGTVEKAVYRPSTGQWFVNGGSPFVTVYGASGDIPVAGDYDGNGTTDKAVFRPSTGQWFVNGGSPSLIVYGASGDQPQPGDYDGNGTTDKAVFRPSTGAWFVQGGSPEITIFGLSTDVPLPLPNAIRRFFF